MQAEPGLQFWLGYAERRGALCETYDDERALVVLPPALRDAFDLPETLAVTSDPEVAAEGEALLVIAGHPVVDAAARSVLVEGDAGHAYLPRTRSTPPDAATLLARLREALPVDHGRIDLRGEPQPAYLPVLRLGALVTYTLSDRFQEREEVWVDARTGLPLPEDVRGRLETTPSEPAPDAPYPIVAPDLLRALGGAHAHLIRRGEQRGAELARQAAGTLRDELLRAEAYYADALASIQRRRESAPPERQALLDAQAEATATEAARRRQEIEEKHRARFAVQPFRLHLLFVPGLVLPLDVRRGERRYPLHVVWWAHGGRFASVLCPHCGQAAPLVAGREHLGCSQCLPQAAARASSVVAVGEVAPAMWRNPEGGAPAGSVPAAGAPSATARDDAAADDAAPTESGAAKARAGRAATDPTTLDAHSTDATGTGSSSLAPRHPGGGATPTSGAAVPSQIGPEAAAGAAPASGRRGTPRAVVPAEPLDAPGPGTASARPPATDGGRKASGQALPSSAPRGGASARGGGTAREEGTVRGGGTAPPPDDLPHRSHRPAAEATPGRWALLPADKNPGGWMRRASEDLPLRFWTAALEGHRNPPYPVRAGSALATVYRLFGPSGPLRAIGYPPALTAKHLTSATAAPHLDLTTATTGELVGADDRQFPYTLRWRLDGNHPQLEEVLPYRDVRGLRLPSHAQFAAETAGLLDRHAPRPRIALDPVAEALWRCGLPLDGLPLVVRALTRWWQVPPGTAPHRAKSHVVLAVALLWLVGQEAGMPRTQVATAAAYGVELDALRAVIRDLRASAQ